MSSANVHSLSNGLRVVTLPISERQKAAMMVAVRVGSIDETTETDGISHFTEHLLFKSNRHRSSRQLAKDMEWKGIITDAFTDRNCTAFYVKSPPHTLIDAIQAAYEAYTNLDYFEAELETERDVVNTEIRRCRENPSCHVIHNLLLPHLFRGTDLERNVFGLEEVISRVSRRDLIAFKEQHYVPEKTVISIVGNFNEDEVLSRISKTFGSLRNSLYSEEMPNLDVRVESRDANYDERKEVELVYLAQALRAPDEFSGDDYFAIRLLNSAIGDGFSSRMFRELRDKRGIGYAVHSMYLGYPENAVVYFVGGLEPIQLQEVREILDRITNDIVKNGLSNEEIEGVKNKEISRIQDQLELVDYVAVSLFKTVMFGLPVSILDDIHGFKSVSAEAVCQTAGTYLSKPRVEAGIRPVQRPSKR